MKALLGLLLATLMGCAGQSYVTLKDDIKLSGPREATFCSERALELHKSSQQYAFWGTTLAVTGGVAGGVGTVMSALAANMSSSEGSRNDVAKAGVIGLGLGTALLALYAYVDWEGQTTARGDAAAKMAGAAMRIKQGVKGPDDRDPFQQCLDLDSGVAAKFALTPPKNGGAETAKAEMTDAVKQVEDLTSEINQTEAQAKAKPEESAELNAVADKLRLALEAAKKKLEASKAAFKAASAADIEEVEIQLRQTEAEQAAPQQ